MTPAMLELQSTLDRFMAVRLMGYTALLYQDVIAGRNVAAGGKLPLVVPIVLYNGGGRWWAACDIGELIEPTVDSDALVHPPGLQVPPDRPGEL